MDSIDRWEITMDEKPVPINWWRVIAAYFVSNIFVCLVLQLVSPITGLPLSLLDSTDMIEFQKHMWKAFGMSVVILVSTIWLTVIDTRIDRKRRQEDRRRSMSPP